MLLPLVTALDDGSTSTGSMMATTADTTLGETAITTSVIDDGELYLECMGV